MLMWLMSFGWIIYILTLGAIILIGSSVIGFAFYVAVNRFLDWRQERTRRPMATALTSDELHRRRQERSAEKRLQIRVSGWARK